MPPCFDVGYRRYEDTRPRVLLTMVGERCSMATVEDVDFGSRGRMFQQL